MIRRFRSYLENTFDNQIDKNTELEKEYYKVKNNRNRKPSKILQDLLVIALGLTLGLLILIVIWIENLYLQGYLAVFGRGDPK